MPASISLQDALVAARIATSADDIPAPVATAGKVLYDASKAAAERYAPQAPEAALDAALVRMLAYLWQLDSAANPRGYQSALRNSGAAGELAAYRKRRAGLIGGEADAAATPPEPTPGAGLPEGGAAGGLLYRTLQNALAWLGTGDDGAVLTLGGGLPLWKVPAAAADAEARAAAAAALESATAAAATAAAAVEALEATSAEPTVVQFADLSGTSGGGPTETAERFDLAKGRYLLAFAGQASRNNGPLVSAVTSGGATIAAFGQLSAALSHRTLFADVQADIEGARLRLAWRASSRTAAQALALSIVPLTRQAGADDETARAGIAYLEARVERLDDLTVDIEDDAAHRVYQPAAVATEGGMDEVSDFPADAAAAASDFGAADGTNSIAVADGATVKIVFRIPKGASRTAYQVDAAGSLQVSSVDPVGGFGANVSGAWKYYQLSVKNVSGASTDVRLTVHDDVYRWRGKTLWPQVEGQTVDHRLDGLAAATSDLHAGSPATGWSDISAAAQGGIREGAGGQQWTLTTARAVGNSDWRLALDEAQATGNYGLIRIPAAADARSYRLEFTASADLGGGVSYGDLSHWTRIGESSDGNWQYYTGPGTFSGDASVVLQATGSAAHHGTSLFEGRVISTQVLAALGLADLAEANRGKFLKRTADEKGFEYADAPGGAKPWTSLLSEAEGDGGGVRGWDSKNTAGADEIGSRSVASVKIGAWRWVGSLVDSSLQKCVLPEGWSELWATGVGLSARLLAADITTAAYNDYLGTNVPFQYVRGTSRARGKNLIAFFAVTSSRELLIGFDADGGPFDPADYSANMNIKVRVR